MRGQLADLQVFEETRGLKVGDPVELQEEMLSVVLGPGLLGQIYDGLQNPLPELAEQVGFFLKPGVYIHGLSTKRPSGSSPRRSSPGDVVAGGRHAGHGSGRHLRRITSWCPSAGGAASPSRRSPRPAPTRSRTRSPCWQRLRTATQRVTMQQTGRSSVPLNVSRRRLMPDRTAGHARADHRLDVPHRPRRHVLHSRTVRGRQDRACSRSPSRYAEIDIVIIAACGERAGEVVETLRDFPELTDPRTGRSLMERTIIICNTSAMPVAAREASVYTGGHAGRVLSADGPERAAAGRLDLALGAGHAGAVRAAGGDPRRGSLPGLPGKPHRRRSTSGPGPSNCETGASASLTIGGTVSPAGGNFEEPVTQGTLKVVGAFHGLSRARSDARRYPAIDPLDSWSKYRGIIDAGEGRPRCGVCWPTATRSGR